MSARSAPGASGSLGMVQVGTPLGELTVIRSDRGVVATVFDDGDPDAVIDEVEARLGAPVRARVPGLAGLRNEVEAYFEGRTPDVVTPPDLSTLPLGFVRRVLETTARIPAGELWTYGDVAAAAGSPRGGRAAGNALGVSPIELFVPCHRVVHAAGTLGGYGRHDDRKRWLLRHEGSL
jgi:methylated-DNA-[protein]-cysteine S-methyltransferase